MPPYLLASLLSSLSFITLAFLSGVATAFQATINARAALALGAPSLATFFSFSSGCLLLSLLLPLLGGGLCWRARPSIPLLLPGVLGAAYVSLTNFLTPPLGFSAFFVSAVTAQLFAAAAMDATGWGGAAAAPAPPLQPPASAASCDGPAELAPQPLAPAPPPRRLLPRAAALCLAALGAGLAVSQGLTSPSQGGGAPALSSGAVAGCVLGAAAAGGLMVVQAALNRGAAAQLPSRAAATWWSFHCGVLATMVVYGVEAGIRGLSLPHLAAFSAAPPYFFFLGGVLGVVVVFSSIRVTQALGSQAYFTLAVCGQLSASAAIDEGGWLGAPVRPVAGVRAAGVALVALACGCMFLLGRGGAK